MKKRPVGRPPLKVTPEMRKTVEAMVAYGIPEEAIGGVVGCSGVTLRKYFSEEIAQARAKANAKVAETLFQQACAGNTTAMIFWLKCRAGWKENQEIELAGYPNPTVGGAGGHGMLRDTNRTGSGSSLDRQSLTEYNLVVGQPVEWPALRAARQRVADLGLATANVGMLETRLNLTSQVKVAFYDLLLAQQDADLAKQNLDTVEGVARIVKARVKSGEAPQFESIKAEVEVLKARQQLARAENVVRISRVVVDTLAGGALGPSYLVHGEFRMLPRDLQIEALMARMMDQHPTIQRLLKSRTGPGRRVAGRPTPPP